MNIKLTVYEPTSTSVNVSDYTPTVILTVVDNLYQAGSGNQQIQSDWNQTDSTKKDFIKNKPTIPSINGLATENYVDTEVSSAVYSVNSYTDSAVSGKVDKIAGKGLSTNDLTDLLKSAYDAAVTSISDIYQQLTGKADKSIVKCIVGSFNTNASLTGVTTEQILGTISIPANTYASNGNMQMEGLLTKLGTSGSVTFRVRVSTDQVPATISSATLVATFGGNSTNLWFPFRRYNIHIDSDTSMICHTPSSSIADDITALTSITSLTVNQTVQQYYHITGQLTSAADVVTLKKFIIYK